MRALQSFWRFVCGAHIVHVGAPHIGVVAANGFKNGNH